MTEKDIKFANRLFWQVKGHLIPECYSEKDVELVLNSYFKRLWGNHEAHIHLEGFEEAWKNRKRVCSRK